MATTLAELQPQITPAAPWETGDAACVALRGVSWDTLQRLLADTEDRSVPRLTYHRGVLEIVSPTQRHEAANRALATIVHTAVQELDGDLLDIGSMTFERADLEAEFEPDTGFYIANELVVRDREQIRLAVDPPPDLLVEVDVTTSSIRKLDLFAEVGVPEVWRIVRGRVVIHRLAGDTYEASPTGAAFPWMTADDLTDLLARRRTMRYAPWVRTVRAWVRERTSSDY